MEPEDARGEKWVAGRLAVAVAAGCLVHLALFNASKDEEGSSTCYSLLGYEVPCGNLSYAAAAVTTCVIAVLLLTGTTRRPSLLGVVAAAVVAAAGIGLMVVVW